MKYFLLFFLILLISCGDNSENRSKNCDPTCQEWENCIDQNCELKDDRCDTDMDCDQNFSCNLNLHICEEISVEKNYNIELKFTRLDYGDLNPIEVEIFLKNGDNLLIDEIENITVELENSDGSLSELQKQNGGSYIFTITGIKTGEYPITVTYSDGEESISIKKVPLILQKVDQNWKQPMMVSGYPNTEGYEDGVTITPDGEYLFVHTGPYKFSSLFVYNESRDNGGCGGDRLSPTRCEHPWINNTYGSYTAPERPGFFDGRFSNGVQLHNAVSWGVPIDGAPNYAISTMFFGFKKQSDGTFKEPFYIAFNDMNDGIIGPYGLSFKKNSDQNYTIIFTLRDSLTDSFDVYTVTEQLGDDINLGDYQVSSPGNPPERGGYFPSQLVDFGDNSGTQGNPFLYYKGDQILSIWTDDEYDNDDDTKKISLYHLESGDFPDSGVWKKVILPDKINGEGENIQPTFTGDRLFFTRDTNIVCSEYSGEDTILDYQDGENSWGDVKTILQKDTTLFSIYGEEGDIGKIIAIGEPTIAIVDGKEILYFVYGVIRGNDPITGIVDIDMQAGYIEKK